MTLDHAKCPLPIPLSSAGACCWFNSLLQSLLGLSSLNVILNTRKSIFQSNPVATAYIAMCNEPSAVNHNRLLAAFTSSAAFKRKNLMFGRHICAEEGFSVLIEALNSNDVSLLCYNSYSSELHCLECSRCDEVLKRETNYEIHMRTPIVFANQKDFCDWIHVHEDSVEDFQCRGCQSKDNMVRVDVLKALHEVVVCCFVGLFADQPKWFPEQLVFPGVVPGAFLRYQLVAKIERGGVAPTPENAYNASGGHYWCHVLRGQQWYLCDDDKITPNGDPQPTQSTFIVMYHLM